LLTPVCCAPSPGASNINTLKVEALTMLQNPVRAALAENANATSLSGFTQRTPAGDRGA
jgi:hypothetical protein